MKFESSTSLEKYLIKYPKKLYWLLAFMLTAIIYTMIFSVNGLLANGEYVIARSDMMHQHLPFIEYFKSVLQGEHSYWFSWDIGMGFGTAGTFAYYLMSPFNVIFLLFNHDSIMTSVALVVILKAATASAVMQLFLQYFYRNKTYSTVIFAVSYALCSYQVAVYFALNQTDYLYIFPLVMLGIVMLIREQKITCLILSHILLFGVCFYMGYMIGICSFALGLLFFSYKIDEFDRNKIIKIIAYYVVTVVSTFMATAVIWLPAANQLFEYRLAGASQIRSFINNLLGVVNNLFIGQMQSLYFEFPMVYCGTICLILVPCYFLNRKINRKERIFMALSLAIFASCMCFEKLNYILHAFDTPQMFDFRYSFVFSFILCCISCKEITYVRNIYKKYYVVIPVGMLMVYCAMYFYSRKVLQEEDITNSLENLLINIAFVGLWFAVIYGVSKRKIQLLSVIVVSTVLLAAELCINGTIVINRMNHTSYRTHNYNNFEQVEDNTMKSIEDMKEYSYSRVNVTNERNYNVSLERDFNSVMSFNSFENEALMNTLSSLGVKHVTHGLSGRGMYQVLNSLFCIELYSNMDIEHVQKFDLLLFEEINNASADIIHLSEGIGSSPIAKNDRCLSLGYMVDKNILKYTSEKSAFKNQDKLISLMVGENINCYKEISPSISEEKGLLIEYLVGENEDLDKLVGEDGIEHAFLFMQDKNGEATEDSVYKYSFDESNNLLYAYLYNSIEANREAYVVSENTESFMENSGLPRRVSQPYIFEIGKNEEGDREFNIVLPTDTSIDYYEEAFFASYDDKEFQKAYDILRNNQWQIENFEDGHVKGNIDAENGGMMFTSIPYGSGWNVYVDGHKSDIIPLVENAFCGVELTAGSHMVEMIYEQPWKNAAIIISILGLLMTGSIWMYGSRKVRYVMN